jgi:hypothetical protein
VENNSFSNCKSTVSKLRVSLGLRNSASCFGCAEASFECIFCTASKAAGKPNAACLTSSTQDKTKIEQQMPRKHPQSKLDFRLASPSSPRVLLNARSQHYPHVLSHTPAHPTNAKRWNAAPTALPHHPSARNTSRDYPSQIFSIANINNFLLILSIENIFNCVLPVWLSGTASHSYDCTI